MHVMEIARELHSRFSPTLTFHTDQPLIASSVKPNDLFIVGEFENEQIIS